MAGDITPKQLYEHVTGCKIIDPPSEQCIKWGEARSVELIVEENAALRAELDEIKRSYKEIVDSPCGHDMQHCACVPALQMRCEKLESIINTIEDRHHPDSEWCAEAKEALK